jgi:hypothetical protein
MKLLPCPESLNRTPCLVWFGTQPVGFLQYDSELRFGSSRKTRNPEKSFLEDTEMALRCSLGLSFSH